MRSRVPLLFDGPTERVARLASTYGGRTPKQKLKISGRFAIAVLVLLPIASSVTERNILTCGPSVATLARQYFGAIAVRDGRTISTITARGFRAFDMEGGLWTASDLVTVLARTRFACMTAAFTTRVDSVRTDGIAITTTISVRSAASLTTGFASLDSVHRLLWRKEHDGWKVASDDVVSCLGAT